MSASLPAPRAVHAPRSPYSHPLHGTLLPGAPLTGDAWVNELKEDVEELLVAEKKAYDAARGECEADGATGKRARQEVDLGMRIKLVDGDVVIADTAADGGFLATCQKFEEHIKGRFAPPMA